MERSFDGWGSDQLNICCVLVSNGAVVELSHNQDYEMASMEQWSI